MSEESKKRRLSDLDRFLTTKRNVLFWSSVLIAVELLHGSDAITPSALGANIAVPPSVLGVGISAVLTYHFVSFWIDRRSVLQSNDDVGRPKYAGSIEERVKSVVDDVATISKYAAVRSESFAERLEKLKDEREGVKSLLIQARSVISSVEEYNSALQSHMKRTLYGGTNQDIPVLSVPVFSPEADALIRKYDESYDALVREYGPVETASYELNKNLSDFVKKSGRLSSNIVDGDRVIMNFWYTGATVLLALSAYMLMVVDISTQTPMSCRLSILRDPSSIRSCPKARRNSGPVIIPEASQNSSTSAIVAPALQQLT